VFIVSYRTKEKRREEREKNKNRFKQFSFHIIHARTHKVDTLKVLKPNIQNVDDRPSLKKEKKRTTIILVRKSIPSYILYNFYDINVKKIIR